MTPWLPRALVMVLLHLGVGVGVEVAAARVPEQGGLLRLSALAVLGVVALGWGAFDGARATRPGHEPSDDLAGRWLKAGLAAAPVAAFLGWLVRVLALDATGLESLWPQLTGGAAFTALLVIVPAVAGLGLGRWLLAPTRRQRAVADTAAPEDAGPADAAPANAAPAEAADVAQGGLGGRATQSSTAPAPDGGESRAMAE